MEYQGQGWMNPDSNEVYAQVRTSTEEHPLCPVCEMDVDASLAPKSAHKGKTYYFCTRSPGSHSRMSANSIPSPLERESWLPTNGCVSSGSSSVRKVSTLG